jgi:hypothetical protein
MMMRRNEYVPVPTNQQHNGLYPVGTRREERLLRRGSEGALEAEITARINHVIQGHLQALAIGSYQAYQEAHHQIAAMVRSEYQPDDPFAERLLQHALTTLDNLHGELSGAQEAAAYNLIEIANRQLWHEEQPRLLERIDTFFLGE